MNIGTELVCIKNYHNTEKDFIKFYKDKIYKIEGVTTNKTSKEISGYFLKYDFEDTERARLYKLSKTFELDIQDVSEFFITMAEFREQRINEILYEN